MDDQPLTSPTEVPGFLHGYYEGTTEQGDEVAFIVRGAAPDHPEPDRENFPWDAAIIANFKAKLRLLVTGAEEGDFDDTVSFDAYDVHVIDNGSFLDSQGEAPLLFALNGLLLPDGHAMGTCIGIMNSSVWRRADRLTDWSFGSSGWRKWQADWKDREGVNALRFLPGNP